jgi:hypothetical protein
VRDVDFGSGRFKCGVLVDGRGVTSSESLELRGGLFTESKARVDLGPFLVVSFGSVVCLKQEGGGTYNGSSS